MSNKTNKESEMEHRPTTPSEDMMAIRARLWDQLSPAERNELHDAAAILDRNSRASLRESHMKIPEGWKLVPLIPTPSMLRVGDGITSSLEGGPSQKILYPPAVGPEDVYSFMVGAAPEYRTSGPIKEDR